MKVGLLGGTFNPIHIAHLLLAEWIRDEFNLVKIFFIPAAIPPHKQDQIIISSDLRLKMVHLAIQGNPYFEASNIEIEKGDISYSIDTILMFRRQYHLSEQQVYFLIGSDSLLDFPSWRKPEQILRNCQVVVYRRSNFDLSKAKAEYINQVILIENPIIDISSTNIRERVLKGYTIKYMVPPNVEEFIFSKALYKKKS